MKGFSVNIVGLSNKAHTFDFKLDTGFFEQYGTEIVSAGSLDAAVVLDNIGTKQYFNITSLETAKYLSERIGDSTITIVQHQDSTSVSKPHGPVFGQPQPGNISRSTSVSRSQMPANASSRMKS